MKILKKNLKEGLIEVQITNPEDLWYLYHIVRSGDLVRGKATRKIKIGEKESSTKRTFTAEIKVEKTEYADNTFRMNGILIQAPEDIEKGAYQSIAGSIGDILRIKKDNFTSVDLKRLDEAVREQAAILLVAIERDEAIFAISKKKGVEILTKIEGEVQKKQYQTEAKDFFKQVMNEISNYVDRYKLKNVIIGGSSMWKDMLLDKADDELKKKIIFTQISSAGEKGIKDLMKTTEANKLLNEDRTNIEINIVEKILAEISRQGLVEYGIDKIKEAAELGAIEILVISEKILKNQFEKCDKLMELVEKTNGEIFIISDEGEHGKQLLGLGGVAAILRYII